VNGVCRRAGTRGTLRAMVGPSRARCPTCKTPVATAVGERPADYPFCSERCRLVDLHKWLTGAYRIPVANVSDEDGESEGDR